MQNEANLAPNRDLVILDRDLVILDPDPKSQQPQHGPTPTHLANSRVQNKPNFGEDGIMQPLALQRFSLLCRVGGAIRTNPIGTLTPSTRRHSERCCPRGTRQVKGPPLRLWANMQNKANPMHLPSQHQLIYAAPAAILPAQHQAWVCSRNDPLLFSASCRLPKSETGRDSLKCK
jgi:hypothetical protein